MTTLSASSPLEYIPLGEMDTQKLCLMQFNIRQGWADWGQDTAWEPFLGLFRTCVKRTRRKAVAACIMQHSPDVVATQEGLDWQLQHMKNDLQGKYSVIGRPRGTGYFTNETSAIFYDHSRWEVVETDDFMFSSMPKVWGSTYEGASYAMITSWVLLEGKGTRVGQRFLVMSTHLDPYYRSVRESSANQLLLEAERLRNEKQCERVVVMGDWNADCTEKAYTTFADSGWTDAVACINSDSANAPGSFTYHAFVGASYRTNPNGLSETDRCIDFIWVRPSAMEVTAALVDKQRYGPDGQEAGGILPSDHYPVIVEVKMK